MTKKQLAAAEARHAAGLRWYDGPELFVPVSGGVDMGIGTTEELAALIADGALPADTAMRPVVPADIA